MLLEDSKKSKIKIETPGRFKKNPGELRFAVYPFNDVFASRNRFLFSIRALKAFIRMAFDGLLNAPLCPTLL